MMTLAIETSTAQGSVALFENEAVLFSESCQAGRSHSSQLFAVLERALQAAPRVDCVAVGLGPGSYAGVRIAISAATGYAVATGARLIGIPSIVTLDPGDYVALGDARRESYYFAVVRGGECTDGPLLIPTAELPERLEWARAQGLPVFASEDLAEAPDAVVRFPCAERLGHLAIADRAVVARDALEPIYLRDPHITQARK